METAAKKKSSLALGVIALMIAWVATCLLSSAATGSSVSPNRLNTTASSIEATTPTTPPNVVLEWSKTRAEVFGPFTANLTERSSESPVNSSRIYDPLDEVALECTVAPVRTAADDMVIDAYGTLSRRADIPGQSHHLNQNAAFRDVIPHADGVSVKLRGNAFSEVGSPHYNAHESMESFWDIFRRGGMDAGNLPTISQYNRALYNGLQESGLSPAEALRAVQAAKRQQLDAGLRGSDLVPRLPGRINQTQR